MLRRKKAVLIRIEYLDKKSFVPIFYEIDRCPLIDILSRKKKRPRA